MDERVLGVGNSLDRPLVAHRLLGPGRGGDGGGDEEDPGL